MSSMSAKRTDEFTHHFFMYSHFDFIRQHRQRLPMLQTTEFRHRRRTDDVLGISLGVIYLLFYQLRHIPLNPFK